MRGSLIADPGDLLLIRVADLHQAELWGDVAVGLLSLSDGQVSVSGNDLSGLDSETCNWLRGRVGRVFSRGNWMDRVNLIDNILLSARHHGRRDEEDLMAEASALAASFGLPGIPLGMPDSISRIDLQRAACIRAFLGDPLLVILEDPTYGAGTDLLKPLWTPSASPGIAAQRYCGSRFPRKSGETGPSPCPGAIAWPATS